MTLKDVFDQEVFVIDDIEYTDQDFQAMSLDALETIKMRINKKMNGLAAAIKEKQLDYANGGEGATKDWFMRKKSSYSINQRVLTYVKYLIKKRAKGERKISDYFMNAAKTALARDQFESILSTAQNEMELQGGEINHVIW